LLFRNTFIVSALIILLSLSSGLSIYAQRYPVRTYTEADGLANAMVFDIKQDSSGLIWIARRSGISSYDGISFRNYTVADGLISTSYSFLKIDSKNKIWALVEAGNLMISSFNNGKWESIVSRRGLKSVPNAYYSALEIIYRNNEPVVLVGSHKDGMFKYQAGQWKEFDAADGLPDNTINSILQFKGNIIVATDKGLTVFDNDSFNRDLFNVSPYFSKKVLAMAAEGNVLWLLGENWLGNFCEGKFMLVSNDFELPVNRNTLHYFIQPDRTGKVYFGNEHKVFCYDTEVGQWQDLQRKNGLITEGGTTVLIDREYNTWIGGFRGITKIQSRRFASFYFSDGLLSNEVASGLEYEPGHFVFGHEGGLTFYDGKSFDKLPLISSNQDLNFISRVLDISQDHEQNLWAAVSSVGLARIGKNKKITWYKAEQGLEGGVYSVVCTPDEKIYSGTSDGLFLLSGERFKKIFTKELQGRNVRKIFPGKANSLFVSVMSRGIMEVKNDKVTWYRSTRNQHANNIYSFLIDSQNRRWVGTIAGLFMIKDSLIVEPDLPGLSINHPVYLILEDHSGRIWFGSDNGLYRWDDHKLDHFSLSDGISGLEFNRSAGFMDFRHQLWFGTNNGLTVYNPELDYTTHKVPPPPVHILNLESGNDTLDPGIPHTFPYNMNNPTFHFQAISFINEEQVKYRYRLEGLDTTWSDEIFYLNNSVRYNHLAPGKYRFVIKAANSLGIWSEPVYSATFRIKQPFWFSGWFIMSFLLILGGIGIFTVRYLSIIRSNARLEDMVSERTGELERSEQLLKESNQAKDNFFSIIAHDLKNPFNVILGMLDLLTQEYKDYTDEERQKMLMRIKSASKKTIDLLENLLTWARAQKGIIPCQPEKFNISELIQENLLLSEPAAHHKDISITQLGEKNLIAVADVNMVNTILRNLISNAIKFTFPGGNIIIDTSYHDADHILVKVQDTGLGMSEEHMNNLFKIEKRMSMKGTNNEMGTGLGLILCRDFIEKNNGKIWVTSKEGVGSTFYIALPLYKHL